MKKRIAAVFVAVCVLLLAFTGCSNPDGKKLLEDAAKKQDKAKSVQIGINFDLAFDMSAGDVPTTLSNNMAGNITMAAGEGKTYMAMDFSMPSLMGISLDEECYYDDETQYLYLRNSSGWRKGKVTDGKNPLGDAFSSLGTESGDSEQMSSQSMASLFMLSKEINTKGRKDFNGVSCYEIEILLNPEAFKSLMSLAAASAGSGLDSLTGANEEMLASMLDNVNIYAYVGSRDGLMHGIDMQMGEAFKAILSEEAGASAADLQMNKTDFNISVVSDYKGDLVSIPDDALNATEVNDADTLMSGSMMLSQFASSLSGDDTDEDSSDLLDDIDIADAPSFDEIRMVDNLTSDAMGDETDTYKSTDPAFYVVAEVSNISEPITVYIDWYKQNSSGDQLIDTVSFDMDADNIVTSTLTPHSGNWPEGEYYVEFSATLQGDDKEDTIDLGSLNNSVFFTVK